ncbi:hypothetical protein PIB30_067655 [Stylosanthes scabra]|uniref:Uncharacterized protein n=1 Tax=Stylosanthes scabra TaxID=79078 RepID=A0ABU6TP95_9FABA|nr:hypothetical protein [Stylosanthes scabra]
MKLITTQEFTRNAPSSGMTSRSSHGWSGPFTILKASPYGHAEIQNDHDGTKFVDILGEKQVLNILDFKQQLHAAKTGKQGEVKCFAAKKYSIDGMELNGALQKISGASNMLNIEESQAAEFCSKQRVSQSYNQILSLVLHLLHNATHSI